MEDSKNIRQGLEGPGQTGGDKAPDRRLKMSGWLQTALDRVRDFAYTVPPPIEAPGAPPKIGLALGGGFARGIAHLGVLHALQQNNIPIHCIAGTSAGALAAVAYASGLPFDEVVRKATALKFGNFAQWKFSKMGLASNQRLARIRGYSGRWNIKDTCWWMDLWRRRCRWMRRDSWAPTS